MASALWRLGATAVLLFVVVGVTSAVVRADDVPEVVVTPYYIPTAISRAGSSVSVITRDDIARSSAGTVADLLRTVPGITVTESGGVGGSTVVNLRGAEPGHTLVLIDGVRVNEPAAASGGFDFATLTVTDIERIEVVRGPQSALYGSDAMGGVINIITRKASKGAPRSAVTVEGGSYGTARTTLSAGGTSGAVSLAGSGTWFHTDGFSRQGNRDRNEADGADKFAGNLNGSIDGGNGVKLDFGIDGFRETAGFDETLHPDAKSVQTRTLVNGFSRLTFPTFDGGLHNSLTAFAMDDSRLVFDDASPPTTTNFHGSDFGTEYQGDFTLGSNGTFLFGSRLEEESGTVTGSTPFSGKRDLYAFYGLNQVNIGDRLHLSFGGRYDGAVGGEGFLTGRATAVYDFPETETRLRGSIGTGAKRPTFYELFAPPYGNSALGNESSIGGDLGIDQTLFDGRLVLSGTGFYNRFHNLIDFSGSNFENVTHAETAGAELSATATIVPGVLTGTASYTYLSTQNLVTGKPLSRRPEHSGTVSLTYTGVERLQATLSATFVGARFNNTAATMVLPAYTRVDVSATYRINDAVSVFGRIENLLNARYQDPLGYNTAGFSVYAGLTWSH